MDKQFLDEVWGLVATSCHATAYWAEHEVRIDGPPWGWIIKVREHNEHEEPPGEWFQLNYTKLESDLKVLFEHAYNAYWNMKWTDPMAFPALIMKGILDQDSTEWDDEIVDIFVQLSTLGEVMYG